MEIHEQAEPQASKPELGQYLYLMNWLERGDRFDFDKDFFVDDEVGSKCPLDTEILVGERNSDVPGNDETACCKLMRKALAVGTLEQSGTETFVDLDSSADDPVGNTVF